MRQEPGGEKLRLATVRSMRRSLGLAATLCVLAAGLGCGGDDNASGPLESALSYVPADTPFVVAVDTDLEGGQYESLQAILDRFPGGIRLDDLLGGQLDGGEDGVSFAKDVKPLLGNPAVISATDVTSFLSDSDDDFVAVLEVEDPEALDRLIDKTKPQEQGDVAGATVYDDDGTVFAVKDDTLVFGGSQRLLEAALERSDAGEGMDAGRFDDGLEGLPDEALARVFLDVQALLDQDPETEGARKVEWVGALRTMGLTASVEDDSANVEFNLKAEGDLTDEDLPLAAGDEAPALVREEGEISFGIRDPRQIVTFFEAALQALEPQDFGDYETGKRAISQQLGVDVDEDIFGQLTGDMSLTLALNGSFGARVEVESPARLRRHGGRGGPGLARTRIGTRRDRRTPKRQPLRGPARRWRTFLLRDAQRGVRGRERSRPGARARGGRSRARWTAPRAPWSWPPTPSRSRFRPSSSSAPSWGSAACWAAGCSPGRWRT